MLSANVAQTLHAATICGSQDMAWGFKTDGSQKKKYFRDITTINKGSLVTNYLQYKFTTSPILVVECLFWTQYNNILAQK